MSDFRFDIDAYLSRIGLLSAPSVDAEGLHRLHEAQFFSIPFENFDIQLGRGIDLQPATLFHKLVGRPRGGYCFELNGLMLMALRALGFRAKPLLARVHLESRPSARTHQLNLVSFDSRPWIIDVGFGAGGLRCPLPLENGRTEEGPGWAFRLEHREPWGYMMQTRVDRNETENETETKEEAEEIDEIKETNNEQWKDSYSFDLSHVTEADIALGNHYTSTSPETHFTRDRVASLPRENGRVSLRNFTVTIIEGGIKTTREVEPGQVYLVALKEYFGIVVDANYADLRPLTEG